MHFLPQWLRDTLSGASKTPLNEVADPETVESIHERLTDIEKRMTSLQFDWAEILDKLTVQASRFSARQRKRASREIDAMDDGEGGVREGPTLVSPEEHGVRAPTPPLTKYQLIQQQIAARRAGGA